MADLPFDGLDCTAPATFDRLLAVFESDPRQAGHSTDLNENHAALAWGQSYILQGLLKVYAATGETRYLDHFAGNMSDVLASRDAQRNVTDYRGLSLPAWRTGYPYTAGAATVPDAAGRPCLQVLTARRPIETLLTSRPFRLAPCVDVVIDAGATPDTFSLTVRHRELNLSMTLSDLTMDPGSRSYAVTRLRQAWSPTSMATGRDVRAGPAAAGAPAPGTYQMASQPVVAAVHTGMITYPLASFARLVSGNAELRRRYGSAAGEAVAACQAAVAVHDREWREDEHGRGWHVFPRGQPMEFDGAEQPLNQFLALGRTLLELAAVTGESRHTDRVDRMVATLSSALSVDDRDAYVWPYWLPWGRVFHGWAAGDPVSELSAWRPGAAQTEDISHGHIAVDFAVGACRDGRGFSRADLARFARTYTRNIATTVDGAPTVWSRLDGAGDRGRVDWDILAATWLPVAPYDPAVGRHVRAVYERLDTEPTDESLRYLVFGVASTVWWRALHRGGTP